MTEPLRESPLWRQGTNLAAQASFAPTMLQRMEQANSSGKLALVSQQVTEATREASARYDSMLTMHILCVYLLGGRGQGHDGR
jgi:hypothetical protein